MTPSPQKETEQLCVGRGYNRGTNVEMINNVALYLHLIFSCFELMHAI
jgi:hypothetical protein